jgi:hypothetical protein
MTKHSELFMIIKSIKSTVIEINPLNIEIR